MKTIIAIALLLVAFGCVASVAAAAPKQEEQKQQLKARFESRYPALREAKSAGKVGETSEGTVEAVKADVDEAARKLIADENTDRTALYKLLADEEGTTPDLVAKRAAARNFERAKKGDYLKEDGAWRQK